MKGYYLFASADSGVVGPASGVEKKVRAQCKALNEYVQCELVILPPVEYKGTLLEKIVRRLPFTAAWRKWKYNGEFDDADFLYIRQVYHDYSFVRYLRAIKRSNKNIRIIYELPTYPYDGESKNSSLTTLAFSIKEKENRKRSAEFFDRIVTYYGQKSIWGVPCIDLINGFDFNKVDIPKRTASDGIHLVSVSTTAFWHGYDRVIEGLHLYYQNGGTENIVYHLVGNIMSEHREAVEKYGLANHVVFHGKLSGEPLKDVFAQSIMGIDVLGGHRKDYPISSSLKSREYAAYGIPIITASPVDYLPRDYEYQFIASYDDSPLDFEKVVFFYHSIFDGKNIQDISEKIRKFAESKCDMSTTMKPVADWLKIQAQVEK